MARPPTPNRERFNFDGFIESLLDLDIEAMAAAITREYQRVDASMSGRGGPQARADGGTAYCRRLLAVGFWLHHGRLPPDRPERGACLRLAERLVERGDLTEEALDAIRGTR